MQAPGILAAQRNATRMVPRLSPEIAFAVYEHYTKTHQSKRSRKHRRLGLYRLIRSLIVRLLCWFRGRRGREQASSAQGLSFNGFIPCASRRGPGRDRPRGWRHGLHFCIVGERVPPLPAPESIVTPVKAASGEISRTWSVTAWCYTYDRQLLAQE